MSPRDWQVRLEDILDAIHNLQTYVQDMTFDEFAADTKSVRAAAYEISIIGEAAARIPRLPEVAEFLIAHGRHDILATQIG